MVASGGAGFKERGAYRICYDTEATSDDEDGDSRGHPSERVRFSYFCVTPPRNTLRVFLRRPSLNRKNLTSSIPTPRSVNRPLRRNELNLAAETVARAVFEAAHTASGTWATHL